MANVLKTYALKLICPYCGFDSFSFCKKTRASDAESLCVQEYTAHRGFGVNVNSYQAVCGCCKQTCVPKMMVVAEHQSDGTLLKPTSAGRETPPCR